MLRGPFNGRLHLHNVPEQIFSNKIGSKVNLSQTIMKKHLSLQKMLQKICSCHLRFSLWYLNNFIKYANVSESLQSSSVGFFCFFFFFFLLFLFFPLDSWLFIFQALGLALSCTSPCQVVPTVLFNESFCFTEREAESLTFSPLELDGNQGCIPPGRGSFSFFLQYKDVFPVSFPTY